MPGGAVLLGVVAMLHMGVLVPNPQFADFTFYAAFGIGALYALRFHSIRLFFALLSLALATLAPAALSGHVVVSAVAILIPVNLLAFSFIDDRGWSVNEIAMRVGFLFLQFIFIAFLSRPELEDTARILDHTFFPRSTLTDGVPQIAVFLYVIAAVIFAARFLMNRKPLEAGFLWGTATTFFAQAAALAPVAKFFMSMAAGLLTLYLVESSYRMAYHDELTGLPARRAFNDALLRLGPKFAIAVVDVDFFKKFNDTYGHETGDQVLRMVASRLARVSGGGQSFRFGGEEFCVVFAGKSVREALPYLEQLRAEIAESSFVVRGQDRPARTIEDRKDSGGRQRLEANVTISIGVAGPSRGASVDDVLLTADKALYRAKENGRNRVEAALAGRKATVIQPQANEA